jgi:hypothetical protein
MLYDECGKFVEFCVWDEEKGVERKFRVSDERVNKLVKTAWDEKWLVEVVVEEEGDQEVEIVKGIIL